MRITTHKWLAAVLVTFLLACPATMRADNAQQARAMFYKTWNMVASPKGVQLSYSVNIIRLYKTAGTIWLKGKKKHYVEKRYVGWDNGKYMYRADNKKRTVELHNSRSPKRDKYLSKFKFSPADYNYSWTSSRDGIVISLDRKRGAASTIRHAKAVLDRRTRYPKALRIKVAFFWTTIKIFNFRPGIADDSIFTYPAWKYKGYKFKNKWPD